MINRKRKLFWAGLISNYISGDFFRHIFINDLNKYKRVDIGGKFYNNDGKRVKNKIQFHSSYKFSIAIENSGSNGYFSEKIIQSFLSGTIPIYYGEYMIDEHFNPKSFILIKGEKDIQKKLIILSKLIKMINYIIQLGKKKWLYSYIIAVYL